MGESDAAANVNAPRDPRHLVLILFKFLGMGCLLPWNFFISVHDYWMYKFRNVSETVGVGNASVVANLKTDDGDKLSDLQLLWTPYLSIASMIPNVTFLLLNAAFGHRYRPQPRLIVSMIVIMVIFIFTTVTAAVNTDSWQHEFLIITLLTVVVINIAVAILQGSLSGVAASFPPRYMGSVVQGQALGGIFAAGTNVVVLALGGSSKTSAFYCFITTIVFLLLTLVAFLVVSRTEFFKFYIEHKSTPTPEPNAEGDNLINQAGESSQDVPKVPQRINVLQIAAQIWVWILGVFLTFMVTLSVFPAITAMAVSENKGMPWGDKYFIPVGCFLVFNIGDYVGRILASFIQYPKATKAGGCFILAMSLFRFLFLPLFLFCNVSPENRSLTSVYFTSDWVYLLAMVIFSVTNGYIGNIAMMFAPKVLPEGPAQSTAASVMVSFLVLGLAVGSALSLVTVRLL